MLCWRVNVFVWPRRCVCVCVFACARARVCAFARERERTSVCGSVYVLSFSVRAGCARQSELARELNTSYNVGASLLTNANYDRLSGSPFLADYFLDCSSLSIYAFTQIDVSTQPYMFFACIAETQVHTQNVRHIRPYWHAHTCADLAHTLPPLRPAHRSICLWDTVDQANANKQSNNTSRTSMSTKFSWPSAILRMSTKPGTSIVPIDALRSCRSA